MGAAFDKAEEPVVNPQSAEDTIAALATPAGRSALAVIRASGPLCRSVAHALLGHSLTPRKARYMDYGAIEDGRVLDDVLIIFFEGPHSYTGEDSLEISCHGNPLIIQLILEDLFARGMRPAEAGEFTRRAFLSGRIDLSQAEAVLDIIQARSERMLAVARQQLKGSLGRQLEEISGTLLQVLARIEAYIDFPEDDLPREDRGFVRDALENVLRGTSRLLATNAYGSILRDGLKVILLGEPNVGKSSLLNALAQRERALVSNQPGTTRDFIEESLFVGPYLVRLIDTAGLNPSPDTLEKLGIEKAVACAEEADLILWVVDATTPCPPLPSVIEKLWPVKPVLVVKNKADLLGSSQGGFPVREEFESFLLSAVTKDGLDALAEAMLAQANRLAGEQGSETIAINVRHADALRRAKDSLAVALAKFERREPIELVASDLRAVLDAYGEICGRIDNERVLDQLFSTFCIGK